MDRQALGCALERSYPPLSEPQEALEGHTPMQQVGINDQRGTLTQEPERAQGAQLRPRTGSMKIPEGNGKVGTGSWEHSCVDFITHRESQATIPQSSHSDQAQIQSHYRHKYSPS